MQTNLTDYIRPVDQAVLDLLRQRSHLSISELTEALEVTATAVRQRLERLLEVDLVSRQKVGAGRGRPQFRYALTPLGTRYASASYADLASALWHELMEMPSSLSRQMLERVAHRMSVGLKASVPQSGDLTERMSAMAEALGRRKVPASVSVVDHIPILDVHACPYPELTQHDDQRQLCEMEQDMISEAIGQPVLLDCCRLDGHHHCQFRPAT